MIKARGKNQRYLEEVTAKVLEIHNLNQDMRRGDIDEALVKAQIYLFDCNNTEIDFLDVEIGLLFLEPGVVVKWFTENGECVRERRFLQSGGILVSLRFPKSKEFSAFNVIEACEKDAERKGLEFRNVKEIDSKVSKAYREVIYTAEVKEMSEEDWRKNQGLCKHGYRVSHCIWCSVGAEKVYDRAVNVLGGEGDSVMNEMVKAIEEAVKTDKEEFDLTQIPFESLKRIGGIFKEGEVKYGKGNWKLGKGDLKYRLERANHAIKHLYQYVAKMMEGKENEGEDDLGKVAWFCMIDMELVSLRLKEAEKNETK